MIAPDGQCRGALSIAGASCGGGITRRACGGLASGHCPFIATHPLAVDRVARPRYDSAMNAFNELRQHARDRRDRAVDFANDQYNATLARIAAIERRSQAWQARPPDHQHMSTTLYGASSLEDRGVYV